MLIGLCGLKNAGKDTLAKYIIDNFKFEKVSFSDTLKDITCIIFGWPREKLEGVDEHSRQWRETVDKYWASELNIENFTPRYALTFIGTDLFRKYFSEDIWVKVAKKKVSNLLASGKNVVVTDCRFLNEITLVKECGGKIIHIYRDLPNWFFEFKNNKISAKDLEEWNVHRSEYEWILSKPDHIIMNTFGKDKLYSQFDYINEN